MKKKQFKKDQKNRNANWQEQQKQSHQQESRDNPSYDKNSKGGCGSC